MDKVSYATKKEIYEDYKEIINKFGFKDKDIDFSNVSEENILFICESMHEKLKDDEDDE